MRPQLPVCDFGWKAVDFDLPATDGKRYTLADVHSEKGLLVMFICNHCPAVQVIRDRLMPDGHAASTGSWTRIRVPFPVPVR